MIFRQVKLTFAVMTVDSRDLTGGVTPSVLSPTRCALIFDWPNWNFAFAFPLSLPQSSVTVRLEVGCGEAAAATSLSVLSTLERTALVSLQFIQSIRIPSSVR
jgi:hypothetical protein